MSRSLQAAILFGTFAVFLYLVNSGIIGAERNLANGTLAYLDLAPVDPRSLIQGDYMRLDYAIEREAWREDDDPQRRGQIVAVLDENRVARFDRYYDGGALASDEILINYTTRAQLNNIRVGVDSFFFQEGLGDEYAAAEYAEVRITPGGGVMLVDLVGDAFQPLVE